MKDIDQRREHDLPCASVVQAGQYLGTCVTNIEVSQDGSVKHS